MAGGRSEVPSPRQWTQGRLSQTWWRWRLLDHRPECASFRGIQRGRSADDECGRRGRPGGELARPEHRDGERPGAAGLVHGGEVSHVVETNPMGLIERGIPIHRGRADSRRRGRRPRDQVGLGESNQCRCRGVARPKVT